MLAALVLTAALHSAAAPRMDVAFALDTTGSMGDEIDVVKEKIVQIARNVSAGQPRPDVRFGIVAFRDRGDAYVTKAFPFSREIADVQKTRSEEHTSELQSRVDLVCRLLLEKKKLR